MKRIKADITGRVQGVVYRYSCLQEATRLGLSGWVKNRNDGSVRLEAVGSKEALQRLIEWCHQGPTLAIVERVEVSWEDAPEQPPSGAFEITY